MARLILLLTVLLAVSSFAQVTVTNNGFATSTGPAIPATPVSPPIMYTPIIQLGQAPTQPIRATVPSDLLPPTQPQVNPEASTDIAGSRTPFNFGVAQFNGSAEYGSVGEDINGKSLGEVAREQRQHPNGTNARVYTNSDIDQLNQVGNSVNVPSAQANNSNDNWSPNNGIITPENSQPGQNSVAAPPQSNQQMPTGNHSPFAPTPQSSNPQSYSPAGIQSAPQPPAQPQAEARPFSHRERTEIAQTNPQEEPLAQGQPASQAEPAQNQPQAQLPRTASKLPLVGIAGLFSVSMGIFVRYQRAKAK
jgi:hypothetical protein